MHARQSRIREREVGVQCNGFLVHLNRRSGGRLGERATHVIVATQVIIVCLDILRRDEPQATTLGFEQCDVQRPNDPLRDVGLNTEDFVQRLVIDLRPQLRAIGSAHDTWRDPYARHPVSRSFPADAALQHILNPELATDLGNRFWRSLVESAAQAANHSQVLDDSELRSDLFGHSVREVVVFSGAKIREG